MLAWCGDPALARIGAPLSRLVLNSCRAERIPVGSPTIVAHRLRAMSSGAVGETSANETDA